MGLTKMKQIKLEELLLINSLFLVDGTESCKSKA